MKNTALIVLDTINEILHPEGKLSGKGYAAFAQEHGTIANIDAAISTAKKSGQTIVFVRLGFANDYSNHPEGSILLGKAKEFGALKSGAWATEFVEGLSASRADRIFEKQRISPFFGTDLETYLRERGITEVQLAGVATDLVVESAARDAHDRDFGVIVLADCCAAASQQDHLAALMVMAKFAHITGKDQ